MSLKSKLLSLSPGIGSKLMGNNLSQREGYNAGKAAGLAAQPGEDYAGEMAKLEGDLPQIYGRLHDLTEGSAKRAGTYADTPEFKRGLDSEAQAESRGARLDEATRINALRRLLGQQELDLSQVNAPGAPGAAGYFDNSFLGTGVTDPTKANPTPGATAGAPGSPPSLATPPPAVTSGAPPPLSVAGTPEGPQSQASPTGLSPAARTGAIGRAKGGQYGVGNIGQSAANHR